jgi:hypothetical protein
MSLKNKVYKSNNTEFKIKNNKKEGIEYIYDIQDIDSRPTLIDDPLDIPGIDTFDTEYLDTDYFMRDLDDNLNYQIIDDYQYNDNIKNDNENEYNDKDNEDNNKNNNENYLIDDYIKKIHNDNDSKTKSKIICNIINNKREGKAKKIYSNGYILKFKYKNNIKQGKAMLVMNDGIINFNYKDDKRHGLCKIIMLNGTTMTFNFENGIINGDAIIKKSSGDIINLTYKNGKIYNKLNN